MTPYPMHAPRPAFHRLASKLAAAAPKADEEAQPVNAANDKLLYCPPCYGQKPHYPVADDIYKCRVCGRERKDT